jgi:hypothetical protein
MFDRPKSTAGCSANGRRRRRYFSNKKGHHTSKLEIPDWSGDDSSRKYWFNSFV